MSKVCKSMEELIGHTPLLELTHLEEKYNCKGKVIAKVEFLNATGSIKDRAALQMINDAEEAGILTKDTVIIEPTSGNTGIGLAAIGTVRGYKVVIVMPSTMSKERITLMKAYGAEVVLSDGKLGMSGAIAKAEELKAGYEHAWIAGQFENPSNAKAHYLTTGPEIVKEMDGKVDYFVAGVGTGGTITGSGKYLKENVPGVKIVGVEPASSAVLSGKPAGPHAIQGIGAGFVPKVLDVNVLDEVIRVENEDALRMGAEIGRVEGILVGISAGAAVWAAIELAKKEENAGKNIVVILPDSGDRYLSTAMFAGE